PSIGEAGQEKISKLRVLQIGAGGLGSPFALYLVAAGIKELTIIDNDTISISNLQRQILYNETQIGKNKVDIAHETLSKLNSNVEVKIFKTYVNKDTIYNFFDGQDFIVDCSDNLKTKFLVNRTAINTRTKCVIAGVKDFYGQIMTIIPGKTACYDCIFNDPEEMDNESEPLPVIGITPGILGTLEALEVIKTALGLPNLENKLLMVNLLNISFNIIDIVRNENCICSYAYTIDK
ncbi:MAG: HesA/MoeB/ThiF family protein, partial [Promethearchaeota archaeon]